MLHTDEPSAHVRALKTEDLALTRPIVAEAAVPEKSTEPTFVHESAMASIE